MAVNVKSLVTLTASALALLIGFIWLRKRKKPKPATLSIDESSVLGSNNETALERDLKVHHKDEQLQCSSNQQESTTFDSNEGLTANGVNTDLHNQITAVTATVSTSMISGSSLIKDDEIGEKKEVDQTTASPISVMNVEQDQTHITKNPSVNHFDDSVFHVNEAPNQANSENLQTDKADPFLPCPPAEIGTEADEASVIEVEQVRDCLKDQNTEDGKCDQETEVPNNENITRDDDNCEKMGASKDGKRELQDATNSSGVSPNVGKDSQCHKAMDTVESVDQEKSISSVLQDLATLDMNDDTTCQKVVDNHEDHEQKPLPETQCKEQPNEIVQEPLEKPDKSMDEVVCDALDQTSSKQVDVRENKPAKMSTRPVEIELPEKHVTKPDDVVHETERTVTECPEESMAKTAKKSKSQKTEEASSKLSIKPAKVLQKMPTKQKDKINKSKNDRDKASRNSEEKEVVRKKNSPVSSHLHKEPGKKQKSGKINSKDAETSETSTQDSKPTTYEFDFPTSACGMLIGKLGRHVNRIKEQSGVEVSVRHKLYTKDYQLVILEGTQAQIEKALSLLRERFPVDRFPDITFEPAEKEQPILQPEHILLSLPEGVPVEVLVSSVVAPNHIFLQQPTHPTYHMLEMLNQNMNACYAQDGIVPQLPRPIEVGVICAAPVLDSGWYRAQVVQSYPETDEVELRFLDYGGYIGMQGCMLRQIRCDFSQLPFQAVECYLANVVPPDGSEVFPAESNAVMQQLVHGKVLQARVVGHEVDGIPYIQLFEVQGDQTVCLNKELVKMGLAQWIDEMCSSQLEGSSAGDKAASSIQTNHVTLSPPEEGSKDNSAIKCQDKIAQDDLGVRNAPNSSGTIIKQKATKKDEETVTEQNDGKMVDEKQEECISTKTGHIGAEKGAMPCKEDSPGESSKYSQLTDTSETCHGKSSQDLNAKENVTVDELSLVHNIKDSSMEKSTKAKAEHSSAPCSTKEILPSKQVSTGSDKVEDNLPTGKSKDKDDSFTKKQKSSSDKNCNSFESSLTSHKHGLTEDVSNCLDQELGHQVTETKSCLHSVNLISADEELETDHQDQSQDSDKMMTAKQCTNPESKPVDHSRSIDGHLTDVALKKKILPSNPPTGDKCGVIEPSSVKCCPNTEEEISNTLGDIKKSTSVPGTSSSSPNLINSAGSSEIGSNDHDIQSEISADSGRGGSVAEMSSPLRSTSNTPTVYQFDFPTANCGMLIGKRGRNINKIKELSGVEISVNQKTYTSEYHLVLLEGTQTQIDKALALLRERFPADQFPDITFEPAEQEQPVLRPEQMQLSLPEGTSVEVLVSSVVAPNHLFLQQPTHPTYHLLQLLNNSMNACYARANLVPELPRPIEVGVICAAPVLDTGWYRAQVVQSHPETDEVELRFLDYGGYMGLQGNMLRQIRFDFSQLPFQAVECYLANVAPPRGADVFPPESNAVMQHMVQGRVLQAQIVGREVDGVPFIELYDVQGKETVLINKELVNRGLAQWIEQQS